MAGFETNLCVVEVGKELDDTWEWLRGRENFGLETSDFESVLLLSEWQLSPLVKDLLRLWEWAALELRLD